MPSPGYNNYYESHRLRRRGPALKGLRDVTVDSGGPAGWSISPKPTAVEELLAKFTQETRVYRLALRGGMVPWCTLAGFSARHTCCARWSRCPAAKYVHFETLYRPKTNARAELARYQWPYAERLALDEAMHPLTILSTGLYGKTLLPQTAPDSPGGALEVWLQGIKSIVRIDLVERQPVSLWMAAAPNEYGFYSRQPGRPAPRRLVAATETQNRGAEPARDPAIQRATAMK